MEIDKISTIDGLYEAYYENLKALLVLVESELEKFPEGILNEIRSLYDHTARASLSKNPEDRSKEIESARRHIVRALLDCYKVVCIQGEIKIERFEESYKKIRLGEVDSGKFLPKLTQLHHKAKEFVQSAKKTEKSGEDGRGKSLRLFDNAIKAYKDVEQFIEKQSENLTWAASHQKRYFWSSHIISSIIGLVTGCISIWIMYKVLE